MNWLPDIFGRRRIQLLQTLVGEQVVKTQNALSDARKLVNHIKERQNFGRPDAPPNWQTDNVLELRAFLKSPTGQLLMQRARAMEYNRSIANANDVMHTQHSAGVTVGINGTFNWIESLASDQVLQNLSGPTAGQVGKTDTASGDHDDAALVEKFSP